MRVLLLPLLFLAPCVFAQTAPLNDTGQTLCFEAGALAACTPANTGDGSSHPRQDARFGRDAQDREGDLTKIGAGAAGFDYTRICNSGEPAGTGVCPADPALGADANQWACTRDNVTGLIWEVKTEANMSQTFTLNNATNVHAAAVNSAQLCGFNDWRVPTRRELLSTVHRGTSSPPTIDTTFFPNTSNGSYWSSDTSAASPTSAWVVRFNDGATYSDGQNFLYRVRLVRSGQAMAAPLAAFTDNGDGTVTDPATGLMWDRCSWGQTGADCSDASASSHNWQAALKLAVTANAANHREYNDWRLPNSAELESLVDITKFSPAINETAFPGTPSSFFWSSTVETRSPTAAESVYFFLGNTGAFLQSSGHHVRLVRSGQHFDALAPTQIAINEGDGQTATAGSAVDTAPSVIVRDANDNPVGGVEVTFAVASGGGTVDPTTAVSTGADGIAAVNSWTLGTAAGTNALSATATGLTGLPVTFTATGTAGPASQIAIQAGDGQSATAGSPVDTAPSVIVRDANNNPVAGVEVTFAVASGGGTVDPTTAVSTGADGIAAVTSWTLGPAAGTNTLTATATGLTGSPVTFTATGTAGSASQIAIQAGDGQTATAGTAVATPPSVIVRDANDNPVGGVEVMFAVASGGGTVDPTTAVNTGADGIAAVNSWTLGTTAGTNTLTATIGTLSGSPLIFTATATTAPAAPTDVTAAAGNAQATVSWTAPSDTGGAAITGYIVISSPDSQICSTSDTSCTVTGLSNGTEYSFMVIATNAEGSSPASEPSNVVVPSELLFQDRFEEN